MFAVMMRTTKPDDAWSGDKDAVEQPKEKPKPKPKKEKRPRGGADVWRHDGRKQLRHGHDARQHGLRQRDGRMPYPMEYGSDMGGSMPGVWTGMPGMAGGKRALGQFYISHYLSKGYRPTVGMGAVGVAARSYAMVAVKALVPYEKQWEEYERALASATGYSPMQDIPRYLLYVAERAEVSDDPNAPLQWQTISNSSVAIDWARKNFAGFPPEVADEAYLLPGLTMPIPPILMQPYDSLALHSEVPKKKLATNMAMAQPAQANKQKRKEKKKRQPSRSPRATSARACRKCPRPERRHGWLWNDAGAWHPGWAIPAALTWDPAPACTAAGMYGGGMPGMEGYGSTAGYPGSMGGWAAMGWERAAMACQECPGIKQPIVKYKMIRFFDFTAEAGKSYQYRVRVMIEDPNRPLDKTSEPNARILDQVVVDRLAKVTAADEEYQKTSGKPRRTYWLQTEWSEPSNVVTVVSPGEFRRRRRDWWPFDQTGRSRPLGGNRGTQRQGRHGRSGIGGVPPKSRRNVKFSAERSWTLRTKRTSCNR